MAKSESQLDLDTIVSLCKRRGFVYQSADIYGGLNGLYDLGHLGVLLKENIIKAWKESLFATQSNILFLDGAILGPPALWEASGHLEHFHDPMIDCLNCKKRYRTDEISQEKPCPACGKKEWTQERQFNMMFKTELGAAQEKTSVAYLRPETAQTIFVNFKNVISTNRVKMPFGIAQIGKAFRNEITPKQFLFRMREFQQMELEWFCKKERAPFYFDLWTKARYDFYTHLGIHKERIRIRKHGKDELAHYSTGCNDIEYHFPFGWKELEGIADRSTFDLTRHSALSGKDLSVFDDQTQESYIPNVIECSVGVERLFLTILCDAYAQDELDGEKRIVLRLNPNIAPIKAAFLPLTKKISQPMHAIYEQVQQSTGLVLQFDDTGSIGKRYRRQDEIGTPVCFTYDFESEQDNHVTARTRDSSKQERVAISQLDSYLVNMLQ